MSRETKKSVVTFVRQNAGSTHQCTGDWNWRCLIWKAYHKAANVFIFERHLLLYRRLPDKTCYVTFSKFYRRDKKLFYKHCDIAGLIPEINQVTNLAEVLGCVQDEPTRCDFSAKSSGYRTWKQCKNYVASRFGGSSWTQPVTARWAVWHSSFHVDAFHRKRLSSLFYCVFLAVEIQVTTSRLYDNMYSTILEYLDA